MVVLLNDVFPWEEMVDSWELKVDPLRTSIVASTYRIVITCSKHIQSFGVRLESDFGEDSNSTTLFCHGVNLSSLQCIFCTHHGEETNNLLIQCQFSYQVWSLVYRWLGFTIVQHNSIQWHYIQHEGLLKRKGKTKFSYMLSHYTCWCL